MRPPEKTNCPREGKAVMRAAAVEVLGLLFDIECTLHQDVGEETMCQANHPV